MHYLPTPLIRNGRRTSLVDQASFCMCGQLWLCDAVIWSRWLCRLALALMLSVANSKGYLGWRIKGPSALTILQFSNQSRFTLGVPVSGRFLLPMSISDNIESTDLPVVHLCCSLSHLEYGMYSFIDISCDESHPSPPPPPHPLRWILSCTQVSDTFREVIPTQVLQWTRKQTRSVLVL